MIEHYFVEHEVFEIFLAKGVLLKVEVKGAYWLCSWLIIWEM